MSTLAVIPYFRIGVAIYIYIEEFLTLCLEKAQDIRSGTGDLGENFHGGLAVLLCLIVKLNP